MKQYETIEIEVTLLAQEDVVRTSTFDNQQPLPDFPENWGE